MTACRFFKLLIKLNKSEAQDLLNHLTGKPDSKCTAKVLGQFIGILEKYLNE